MKFLFTYVAFCLVNSGDYLQLVDLPKSCISIKEKLNLGLE